jgi:hypothetical protein
MTFEVGRLEASSSHLLADLIELIAALNFDGRAAYRPDDLISLIEGQPDFAENEPRNLRASVEDAWLHLEYRAGRFATAYPFTFRTGALRVRGQRTHTARIYRFLLACSRLRSFNPALRSAWASSFTKLSREVLIQLLPGWAEVRVFDANSDDRRHYYGTNLRKALLVLGKDIAASSVDAAECDAQESSGDAKIDLVGLTKWDDPAPGAHVILGQCAARETDWPTKRLEAHAIGLRAMMSLLHDPVNALFIPVLYRDTNGSWITKTHATGCLLIDRLRIISLLNRRGRLAQLIQEPWFREFEQEFNEIANAMVPAVA